jgi:hypothetical protein
MESVTEGVGVQDRGMRPRAAAWKWATAAAVAGSVALCADANAALTEPGSVRTGHNVSVFHEIDFVATFGHQVGTPLRVEVFRGSHLIARAEGPAVSTPEGGTDTILVDDIVVGSGPAPDPDVPGDIVLTGHARSALGGPVADALEGEFRLTSKLRGGPERIERDGESFKAIYTPPYTMERGGPATPRS